MAPRTALPDARRAAELVKMTGAYPLGCQAMTVTPVSVTAPVHVAASIEAVSMALDPG